VSYIDFKSPGDHADKARGGCICGQDHEAITPEQIVAAEMRAPLEARERDPFPELPGNSTVDFSTRWCKGGVFLSDEAAALCADPDELNRAEARAEAEVLCHVKAGMRTAGLQVPGWARGASSAGATSEPKKRAGRPRKTRRKETAKRRLTVEQRLDRAANAAKARAKKAAKKAAERAELLSS